MIKQQPSSFYVSIEIAISKDRLFASLTDDERQNLDEEATSENLEKKLEEAIREGLPSHIVVSFADGEGVTILGNAPAEMKISIQQLCLERVNRKLNRFKEFIIKKK